MILDNLNDFYHGRAGSKAHQKRTRLRVHWTCRQVRGQDVLDIGCSGGITCILLGREGFNVTGLDHMSESINAANKKLEQEDPLVQERVRFVWAQGSELPFPDESFDTAIAGEVIEHLVRPDPFLQEARRVMRPGGRLILTTPFGLHDTSPDHKDPIYISTVRALVEPLFGIKHAELVDHWLALVLEPSGKSIPNLDAVFLEIAEQRIRALDSLNAERRDRISDLVAERAQSKDKMSALRSTVEEERKRADKSARALQRLRSKRSVRMLAKLGAIARRLGLRR